MSDEHRKKLRTWAPLLGAALCLMAWAGVALASRVEEAYAPVSADGTTNAVVMTSTRTSTGSDTTTAARRAWTQGDPTIVVAPRCTSSGGTACIEVRLFHRTGSTETAITASVATCTFTSTTLGDGLFIPAEPLTFPTYGLQRYEVLFRSVSSGTAHDYHWTLGAASRSGQ